MAVDPDFPPYSKTQKPILSPKRPNLYSIILVALLCLACYFLGTWQHGGDVRRLGAGNKVVELPCTTNDAAAAETSRALDFATHHVADDGTTKTSGGVKAYPPCDVAYSEYTPCEDPERSVKFQRERLIYRERHCPKKSEVLKCRIPAPHGYKNPFPWPQCRDLAWYDNVPHKELTVEKAVQNWIRYEGDRFRFPGGGTMFPNGADAYIDDIAKLIDLKGGSIRTAIDTGCGVASWGGYLMSRNIITMSFAPRDSHEAQVQFALERGVPAMIGVIASKRLPYPSRAFDMAHCSRCLIPWDQHDGIFLMEVDRILRPGGYWILSGPPIRWKKYWKGWERTKDDLSGEQNQIEKMAESLCWTKLVEKGDIAIWRKPINHLNCSKSNRKLRSNPPSFCDNNSPNPDRAWYTNLETCLTRLPQVSDEDEIAGGELTRWPERLNSVPPRISTGTVKGVTPESFRQDSELWRKRLVYYKTVNNQLGQGGRYRNILDMNANLGGFAAALVDDPLWVMNVVPVEAEVNTLGVIYERGLIGTYQNWCEAMSTYPRTYDFIHADSVFTLYQYRCEMDDILLEMDRILRPEGGVVFRDDVDMILKIKRITDGLNWDTRIIDHEDGPLHREKLLFAVKLYWAAPAPANSTL